MRKDDRQRLVASVVARRRIGTQIELRDALEKAGCRVTQATVSRDVAELGLEKFEDELGRPRYALPGVNRPEPRAALAGVLGQFGRRVTAAQNIVVVHAALGSAPAIGRALDRLGHPLIVATLAGDDTCLVIASTAADARKLARELAAAVG
ncbi:MAG: arginine repressor [Gaiellaceae bacterium]